jgi:hypothetical protein
MPHPVREEKARRRRGAGRAAHIWGRWGPELRPRPVKSVRCVVLLVFLAIDWGAELLADFRPVPGIWWTHGQALADGGVAFTGLALWLLVLRR